MNLKLYFSKFLESSSTVLYWNSHWSCFPTKDCSKKSGKKLDEYLWRRAWTKCTLLWIINPEFRSGFKPYLRIYQNLTNLSFIHFSGFLSMTLSIMQYCSDFRQKLQTRLFVYMKSSAWTDTRSIYRSRDKSYFTFV